MRLEQFEAKEALEIEIAHKEEQIKDAEMYLQDLKEQKTELENNLVTIMKTICGE